MQGELAVKYDVLWYSSCVPSPMCSKQVYSWSHALQSKLTSDSGAHHH